jgi:hypothetical protein
MICLSEGRFAIMPQIQCRYVDCIFLEAGLCAAEIIKIDPDEGCLTYARIEDVALVESEEWEDEELDEMWEEDDDELEEDVEDDWIDDNLF